MAEEIKKDLIIETLNKKSFKEVMDDFLQKFPKNMWYSEYAGQFIRQNLQDHDGIMKTYEVTTRGFYEKEDAVKYMLVFRDPGMYSKGIYAIIVDIHDGTWECFFTRLKENKTLNTYEYRNIYNIGQPTNNLVALFLDYRDKYLHDIDEKERKARIEAERKPGQPYIVNEPEPEKKLGLFKRFINWIFAVDYFDTYQG